MNRLEDCPTASRVEICDARTRMSLRLDEDRPIAAYNLDNRTWGDGKRPDGMLTLDTPPPGAVVFIELKGRVDPDEPERPFEQILAGAEHFCDRAESHGAEHHEAWRAGDDLPEATHGRRRTIVRPEAAHQVFGVILTSRGGTRIAPRTFSVGDKEVRVVVVQRHGHRGSVRMGVSELLKQLDPTL